MRRCSKTKSVGNDGSFSGGIDPEIRQGCSQEFARMVLSIFVLLRGVDRNASVRGREASVMNDWR